MFLGFLFVLQHQVSLVIVDDHPKTVVLLAEVTGEVCGKLAEVVPFVSFGSRGSVQVLEGVDEVSLEVVHVVLESGLLSRETLEFPILDFELNAGGRNRRQVDREMLHSNI
jgi:hypothetical protein